MKDIKFNILNESKITEQMIVSINGNQYTLDLSLDDYIFIIMVVVLKTLLSEIKMSHPNMIVTLKIMVCGLFGKILPDKVLILGILKNFEGMLKILTGLMLP